MAREQSAAGAGRGCAAEARLLSGLVEEANEPEHREGSLAHLTLGIVCSEPDHRQRNAQ